ncbi:MAG TPA: hypothetical protein VGM96_02190 [Reyranella sp.]|jgi:hypothetical protein
MVTPTKELDFEACRPRFSTVFTTLGHWLGTLRTPSARPIDPALSAEQAMIRPSQHERIAIEAHREDRV